MKENLRSMYDYRTQFVLDELRNYKKEKNLEIVDPFGDSTITSQHYFGSDAVNFAINALGLKSLSNPFRILDAGSGFGAVARQIAREVPHATIVAVDANEEFTAVGSEITDEVELEGQVVHVTADLLNLTDGGGDDDDHSGTILDFDFVISFLCFLHINEKHLLFKEMKRISKRNSKHYIEDFVSTSAASDNPTCNNLLSKYVACERLCSKAEWIAAAEANGFFVELWDDMTDKWRDFTIERVEKFEKLIPNLSKRHSKETVDQFMNFYTAMAKLFQSNCIEGFRCVLVSKE